MEDGAQREELKLASPPAEAARLMIAALEVAMMLARSYGDAARFDRVGQRLVADIAGG